MPAPYPKSFAGPAALAMLPASPARDHLQALLEDGDADAIGEWLESAEILETVKEVLRLGLRGEEVYDAVEVASLAWDDHTGTRTTCLARRAGGRVQYEAYQDGERIAFRCGGLLARAVQHETDHLNGILFIDRMDSDTKQELKPQLEDLQTATKAALPGKKLPA